MVASTKVASMSAERDVETVREAIHHNDPRGLAEQALSRLTADRERLVAAGAELAKILEKTIYRPEGFSGPPVWWHEEAEVALRRFAALTTQADVAGDKR